MQISLSHKDIVADKGDVLLLPTAAKNGAAAFTPPMRAINDKTGGILRAAADNGFGAKPGETAVLYAPQFSYRRIILVGCGNGGASDSAAAVEGAAAGIGNAKSVAVCCDSPEIVTAAAAGAYRYRFAAESPAAAFSRLRIYSPARKLTPQIVARAAATGEGARLAKHLAEQPGNICTPAFLATTARGIAREFPSVRTTILEEKQLRALKMNSFLAVAQGSALPPKMIVMQYDGGAKNAGAPIALVGKGITFDTGGVSLKPGAAMDEMKFDMCGAAAVFGAIVACARMRLPLSVVAVVPACENMPDGAALKPGDIIRAMNGKTIEVLNTDAEGRLILADALSYSARYKPAATIDIATLTGACVIALGRHFSGMMTGDEKLARALAAAGEESGDGCWRLPLGGKYDRQLKSDYADMANIGGREAGATTAACFLSHFAEGDSWAHLDIAGSAWNAKKRATGRPVPLLSQFLMQRAGW